MIDTSAESYPERPVPSWRRRWLLLLRLHTEIGAEYPSLFGFWVRNGDAFWQYVLRVEEWRLVREAVRRGDACLSKRPGAGPPVGGWRNP